MDEAQRKQFEWLDKLIAEQEAIMGSGWHDLVNAAARAEEEMDIEELDVRIR